MVHLNRKEQFETNVETNSIRWFPVMLLFALFVVVVVADTEAKVCVCASKRFNFILNAHCSPLFDLLAIELMEIFMHQQLQPTNPNGHWTFEAAIRCGNKFHLRALGFRTLDSNPNLDSGLGLRLRLRLRLGGKVGESVRRTDGQNRQVAAQ